MRPEDLPNVTRMGTLTPLIARYTADRLARGEISRETARAFRWSFVHLVESFGHRPIAQFGPKAIDRWLAKIGHLAPATRREYLSRVRGFAHWLISEGLIRTDPTLHVPPIRQPRTQPRTLTEAEVGRLFAVLPDARARAIVWLLVGVGCRCVEVSRLTVGDYDPQRRTILLVGKAGHERVLPVPAEAAEALDAYLGELGAPGGPLIRSTTVPSAALCPKTIGTYVRRWLRAAGVKQGLLDGRSAHGLRRTAASDVMDRTGDIRVVQEMLGHARVETTARSYLRRVSMEQLREAMEGRSYLSDAA